MFTRRLYSVIAAVLLLSLFAAADSKSQANTPGAPQPMSAQTRMLVIRSLSAEFVFVRKVLPQGLKGIVLKNGQIVSPDDQELQRLVSTYGPAAKPGDRAQITNIEIKGDKIVCEINGGPKKKTKWYQHIQVSGMGGAAQLPDDAAKNPKGSVVEVAFDKFVPEMTGDQVRELFSPVFDFKAKSAAEAYIDTVPPKIKDAIKNHEVLVGMNREMVTFSKGRPDKKIREHDDQGRDYEEWLYGQPPQEVEFVRFIGDEVTRLEIMKVDGEKVVRTEREVDVRSLEPKVAEKTPVQRPAHAPTLKRPGEQAEDQQQPGSAPRADDPNDRPRPPVIVTPPPKGTDPGQQTGQPGPPGGE